jgi:SAM-dependent methyltransferase
MRTLSTYLKLSTEYYDLARTISPEELNFYTLACQESPGPILEPMCGTGIFLIPLLKAGYKIEGFDASEHMLAVLKSKAPDALVFQCFVQDFNTSQKYGLIFVPFGSWGLITNKDESQKSLEVMYQHLLPGGKIILEIETVNSAPSDSGVVRRSSIKHQAGSKITLTLVTSYNETTQIFSSRCRYDSIHDNVITATEHEDFQQYLFQFNEMDTMLSVAGFRTIRKYGDHKKTEPSKTSPILIYEAIK